jgi:hypothetical protein
MSSMGKSLNLELEDDDATELVDPSVEAPTNGGEVEPDSEKQTEADEEAAEEMRKALEKKIGTTLFAGSSDLLMHLNSLKGWMQTLKDMHQFPGSCLMLLHAIKRFIMKKRRHLLLMIHSHLPFHPPLLSSPLQLSIHF